jgi:AcrR family transcriptional regulator
MTPQSKGAWSASPLPRGRHKLPREEVTASQRERLLRAMAELAAEKGFASTSVPEVIAKARVSSNTFYRLFEDKTECYIALCAELGDQLLDELVSAREPEGVGGPLTVLERGIDRYLRWWQDRPTLAVAYFVELPAVGRRAGEERERQYKRFANLHRAIAHGARELNPDAPPLRDADVLASVIVATELVARQVRAGRVAQLDEIRDDLRYLLVRLLVSDRAADYVSRAATGRKAKAEGKAKSADRRRPRPRREPSTG